MGDSAGCRNCGAALRGLYCGACGQKRFVDADRRFGHLLAQFFRAATDLDGRFWGSLRALLFRPGVLSRDYLDGRRRRWMSPMALFLTINVAFFLAPTHSDFDLGFDEQVPGRIATLARGADAGSARDWPGQLHSRLTAGLVDRIVARRDREARAASGGREGYGYGDFRRDYDARAGGISKALVIVHVPFMALILLVALAGTGRYYAEHFVVALHYFSFALCLVVVAVNAVRLVDRWLFDVDAWSAARDLALLAWALAYACLQVKRAYAVGWGRALAAGTALAVGLFAVNLSIYRALQFLVTLALA